MKTVTLFPALLLAVFLVCPLACLAQIKSTVHERVMTGRFHVSVDDDAIIFVNGKEVHRAGLGESRSGEMELKTGDRLVLHLHNHTAGHAFLMTFASSDGQSIVSFRTQDFRMVKNDAPLEVKDFTAEEFAKWTKRPKGHRGKSAIPVKNYSTWMWGDTAHCALAGIVTTPMFTPRPK